MTNGCAEDGGENVEDAGMKICTDDGGKDGGYVDKSGKRAGCQSDRLVIEDVAGWGIVSACNTLRSW